MADPKLAEEELKLWRGRFYQSLLNLYRSSFHSSPESAQEDVQANRSLH